MSNNKEKKEVLSFVEILLEILASEEVSNRKENTPIKVEDKILQKDSSSVTYLVPVGSQQTIGSNFKIHNKGLDKYFRETKGTVTHVNHPFRYNCGHCSKEHAHDVIIYYKEINQSFHSSSNAIILASEEE